MTPWGYSPPQVDRIWDIWGSYYHIPKAIFYLLKGDYIGVIEYIRPPQDPNNGESNGQENGK